METGQEPGLWKPVLEGSPLSCPASELPGGLMADHLRIAVDELRRRMEAGEDFSFVDVRNPQAWGESDVKLPDAIRVPLDDAEKSLQKIPREKPVVACCT